LSSVTPREAIEIADRFKAAAGQVILYRRIVSELIKQTDETNNLPAGVGGAGSGRGLDTIEILLQLMNRSGAHLKSLSEAFVLFDRKQNGAVRVEDLKAIFNEARVKIRSKDLELVIGTYLHAIHGLWLFVAIFQLHGFHFVLQTPTPRPQVGCRIRLC